MKSNNIIIALLSISLIYAIKTVAQTGSAGSQMPNTMTGGESIAGNVQSAQNALSQAQRVYNETQAALQKMQTMKPQVTAEIAVLQQQAQSAQANLKKAQAQLQKAQAFAEQANAVYHDQTTQTQIATAKEDFLKGKGYLKEAKSLYNQSSALRGAINDQSTDSASAVGVAPEMPKITESDPYGPGSTGPEIKMEGPVADSTNE